jgi:SPP1 family predicted phage head-tail adaptor
MRVGLLNKRVLLQSPTGSRDAVGERSTTWTDVATVWAQIEPLSVREQLAAAQMRGSITHKVLIRYSSTVSAATHAWRISYGSRVFTVDGAPRNIKEGDRYFEFLCTEGLAEE